MPSIHPASLSVDELEKECSFRRTRRSGPGGQHRNKVESAVVITHEPSGIRAEANERRSQHENRKEAISRLRIRLALLVRSVIDPSECPSKRWKSRISSNKISVSSEHEDFAALLAEAMNIVQFKQFEVAKAAEILGISTSQLIRFIKTEPDAFSWVNSNRAKKNLATLK